MDVQRVGGFFNERLSDDFIVLQRELNIQEGGLFTRISAFVFDRIV